MHTHLLDIIQIVTPLAPSSIHLRKTHKKSPSELAALKGRQENLIPLLSEQQTTLSLNTDNNGNGIVRILPCVLCSE